MQSKKFYLTMVILLSLVLAACMPFGGQEIPYTLRVNMAGDRVITVEYGDTYEDPGASASLTPSEGEQTPVDVQVQVQGQVDDHTLGTYPIKYSANFDATVSTAHRVVKVVDTTPPQITLVADPTKATPVGQPYAEEGFTATDLHDGDITDRVSRVEKDGVVTYTVADSSGNTTTVQREIIYGDDVKPVISLKGDSHVTVMAGDLFREPGYIATDNLEGDVTANVQVVNGVDLYYPGTYAVQYSVTDAFGNVGTASRTVTVTAQPVQGDTVTDKIIYLTFDDGPSAHTPRLLDVLAKYNVKATFFVVNTPYVSTIARAAAEGHTVAIHTATHKFKDIYASEEAYFNDLNQMKSQILAYTGQEANIIRFPGGSSNTISKFNKGIMTKLTQQVTEQGYVYVDWNVDSKDAGGASSTSEVFWNVVNGIGSKKTSIVLQHDTHGFSVNAVERIINWGLANGYTFLPLTTSSPQCHHRVYN